MQRTSKDEWLREAEASQRNIVFPDTARNEGRFWRNIYNGKTQLNILQKVGIGVVLFAMIGTLVGLARLELWDWSSKRIEWSRITILAVDWGIGIGTLIFFLGLFSLSQRYTRARDGHRDRKRRNDQ
jgi:hypothetical protein